MSTLEQVQESLQKGDLEALGACLAAERAVVRLAAADALVSIGTSESHDVLFGGLSHGDPEFRAEIVRRLGKLKDSFTVARVERALQDANPFVRIEALAVLADLGSERSLDVLARQLDESSPSIRRRVLDALARFGPRVADKISRALHDADENVRRAAVRVLSEMPDEGAWRLVGFAGAEERLLRMTDPAAIASAIDAADDGLGLRLAGRLPLDACVLRLRGGRPAYLERLRRADAAERRAATDDLMRSGALDGMRASAHAIYKLDGADALLGYGRTPVVTRELLEARDPRGLECLHANLADADEAVRLPALATAIALKVEGLDAILVRAADDAAAPVRRMSVDLLSKAEGDAYVPILRRGACDRDLGVCVSAVDALAARGLEGPTLFPAYARALSTARLTAPRREQVALLLGRPKLNVGVSALKRALHDESPLVRRASVEALAKVATPSAFDVLASLADTSDVSQLRTAAFALSDAGDPRALVPLIRVSEECRGPSMKRARQRIESDARMKDVDFLIGALRAGRPSVKRVAAEFLINFDEGRVIDPLMAALEDPDPLAQEMMLKALEKYVPREPRVAARVIACIDEGDVTVRQESIRILGDARTQEAVPRIIASMALIFLRPHATLALRRIGDRRGLLALLRRKLRDQEIARQFEAMAKRQKGRKGSVPVHPILRRLQKKKRIAE